MAVGVAHTVTHRAPAHVARRGVCVPWHDGALLTAARCLLYSPRRLRPHPRHVPDPLGIRCCRGGGPSCGAGAGSCFQGALMGFARVVSGTEKRRRAGANPPSPAGSFTGLKSPSSSPSGLSFPPGLVRGKGSAWGSLLPAGPGARGGLTTLSVQTRPFTPPSPTPLICCGRGQ